MILFGRKKRAIIDEAEADFSPPPEMPTTIPVPIPKPMSLDAATGRSQLVDKIQCEEVHARKIHNDDFRFMKSEIALQRVLLLCVALALIIVIWRLEEHDRESTVQEVPVLQWADDQGH